MTVDTTRNGMEEFDITDGANYRRRKTDITQPDTAQADITQPLDYENDELVEKYIGRQLLPPSFPKST